MNPEIQLILGSMLISMALTYGLWVQLRVICLREDLFQIRDELFDIAAASDNLNDPGYRDARRKLNSLIRFAHMWSLPVFAAAILYHGKGEARCRSNDAEFDLLIENSIQQASVRYVSFMAFQTLSGWVVLTMLTLLVPWVVLTTWLRKRVYWLLQTQPDFPDDCGTKLAL